jgi:hypothetical protein
MATYLVTLPFSFSSEGTVIEWVMYIQINLRSPVPRNGYIARKS